MNKNRIEYGNIKIGQGYFNVIAGPCSVESEQQVLDIAINVKQLGATILRGGAYKPRSSPHSFQGLGFDGIKYLLNAKKETGLPVITEIMDIRTIEYFNDVDIIQVGARNMQNFELLKELGRSNKPILLKRGLANTIKELLLSAEYITSEGNKNVILCERGIRTFENFTRNTLDISAIPILKKLSDFPVIVDPSHATGITWLIEPLSKASVCVGADGLMIEVHNNPNEALCDGEQSLNYQEFKSVIESIKPLIDIENKK